MLIVSWWENEGVHTHNFVFALSKLYPNIGVSNSYSILVKKDKWHSLHINNTKKAVSIVTEWGGDKTPSKDRKGHASSE